MTLISYLPKSLQKTLDGADYNRWPTRLAPLQQAKVLITLLEKTAWKEDPRLYNLASHLFKKVYRTKYDPEIEQKLKPTRKKVNALFTQFTLKAMPEKYTEERKSKPRFNATAARKLHATIEQQNRLKRLLKKTVTQVHYSGTTEKLKTWTYFKNNGSAKISKKGFNNGKLKRIYVIDQFGQMHIAKDNPGKPGFKKATKHSTFFNGRPVAGAGKVFFNKEGKITKINNSSGHYEPGEEEMRNTLTALKRHGVDLKTVTVMMGKTVRAATSWNLVA